MEYFEGAPYRINIEGDDSTLVLDSYTRTLKANVIDRDDNVIVDYETKTFFGTLVGNIVAEDNTVILNLEHSALNVNTITGKLIALDGSTSYNHETQTFFGNFDGHLTGPVQGDVLGSNNALLVDYSNNLIVADVRANIINADNTVAFDHETNTFQGNFVGNFLDLEGNVILSSSRISVDEVKTDIIAEDETVAFDKETGTFTGAFVGSFMNTVGKVILDSETSTLHSDVQGSVYYNDNTIAIDADTNTFHGYLLGNVVSDDGSVILDGVNSTLFIDTIVAENISGALIGSFEGTVTGNVIADSVSADDIAATKLVIHTDATYEDNNGPLDIVAFHNSELSTSLTMMRGKGTLETPEPLNLGDNLVSIMFSGVTGSTQTDKGFVPQSAPVAGFEASIDSNGVTGGTGLSGMLTAWVFDSNDNAHKGWVVDSNGDFKATIKDLAVKGETGNAPVNSSAPTKWLEMTVNGETVYMPLYS